MKVTKSIKRKPVTKQEKPPIDDLIGYCEEGTAIEIPADFMDYVLLLYGESGIGKTSVASKIPGSYIVQCDPNRRGIKARQTNIPEMSLLDLKRIKPPYTPWEIAEATINKICGDDSVRCGVVDNFGVLYEHAFRHICYKRMIDHPSDMNDFGKTWGEIEDLLTTAMSKFVEAGKGICIITHDRVREVEQANGVKFERVEPDVSKAAFKWVKACTNYAFYIAFDDKGDRVVQVRSGNEIWTKCCTDQSEPHFYSPSGKPVRSLDAGTDPGQTWQNIIDSFNNKVECVEEQKEAKRKKFQKKD
jgi:hypothetical protein